MKIIGNRKTAKYLVMLAPNHRKVNNKFYSKDLQDFTWNMTKAETFNITPYKIEELKNVIKKIVIYYMSRVLTKYLIMKN